jgi:hypothetical protein
MIPRNPLNDRDVDGNTMAWMAERDYERRNSLFDDEDLDEEEEY